VWRKKDATELQGETQWIANATLNLSSMIIKRAQCTLLSLRDLSWLSTPDLIFYLIEMSIPTGIPDTANLARDLNRLIWTKQADHWNFVKIYQKVMKSAKTIIHFFNSLNVWIAFKVQFGKPFTVARFVKNSDRGRNTNQFEPKARIKCLRFNKCDGMNSPAWFKFHPPLEFSLHWPVDASDEHSWD
jgi:hypothetical protein